MGHSLALCVGRAGCVEAVRWRRGKTAFSSPGLSLPNAAEIVLNGLAMACGRTHFKFCLLHLIVKFTTFFPIETPNFQFTTLLIRC
jgi:hypothetical protein